MRVRVYRNLHKNKWSVVNVKTGRVVGHTDTLLLEDVKWRVQPRGNELVRQCGHKNVHAYAVGTIASLDWSGKGEHRVRYNPYSMTTFQHIDGTPILESKLAEFTEAGYAYVECTHV